MDPRRQRLAIDRVDAGRRAASRLMMVLDDGEILVTAAIPDRSRASEAPEAQPSCSRAAGRETGTASSPRGSAGRSRSAR